VSTVPKRRLLFFTNFFAFGTLSSIHLIFVPEKYGSISKPVFLFIIFSFLAVLNFLQNSAVLLSCHTIAL